MKCCSMIETQVGNYEEWSTPFKSLLSNLKIICFYLGYTYEKYYSNKDGMPIKCYLYEKKVQLKRMVLKEMLCNLFFFKINFIVLLLNFQ